MKIRDIEENIFWVICLLDCIYLLWLHSHTKVRIVIFIDAARNQSENISRESIQYILIVYNYRCKSMHALVDIFFELPPSNSSVLINFKWAVSDNMKCCKIIESARTECIWSWGLILYSTFLISSAACSTISWLVKLYFVWQVQVKTTSTQTSFASQQWWNYETS